MRYTNPRVLYLLLLCDSKWSRPNLAYVCQVRFIFRFIFAYSDEKPRVLLHLFTIAGTNPYSWTLTDPRGGIILNKCYNTLGFPSKYESEYKSNLTHVWNLALYSLTAERMKRRYNIFCLDRSNRLPQNRSMDYGFWPTLNK